MPLFKDLKRTHTCGQLSLKDIGLNIRLNGWIQSHRNLGGLLFIDLRDRYGLTQVVLNPATVAEDIFESAASARSEFVVAISGTVQKRPEGTENKNMATGDIEVMANQFHILSESLTPPFEIADETNAAEVLRLEYRFLDLRRRPLQERIKVRHNAAMAVREYLSSREFLEIETPLLIRSTPEGARDYVVPSRIHRGRFYALPQSPQLLKQILMISGFDRYFQLARCLRDEDLRADRQPEHTQIDMEMSFVTRDDVFAVVEGMMGHLFKKVLDITLPPNYPRIPYDEAIRRWGSDKPDTRFGMELAEITDLVKDGGFKVFADTARSGGVITALCLKDGGHYSRKQLDDLTELAKTFGAGGLAYILRLPDGDKSPILKFIGEETKDKICSRLKAEKGDAVFIVSAPKYKAESILGQIRLHLARQNNLTDAGAWNFLWITDFPLFEYNEDSKRIDAMHNIVSSPREDDLPLIDAGFSCDASPADVNHPWRRIRAQQYDLVLNGVELASGSIRNHRRDIQQKILNILGMNNERAENMFGFLLRALEYGAPPHGGIALGLDRIVALMTGTNTIREVIAFPKSTTASSPMDGAPSELEPEFLRELGIQIIK